MDIKTAILIITCVLNMIGAIGIWLTKVWWTNEFTEAKKAQVEAITAQLQQISVAKDETIKTKDAQIAALENEIRNLREMTPMKIREYFLSTTSQLEEYNNKLQTDLNNAQSTIIELKAQAKITNDTKTRLSLTSQISRVEEQMEELEKQHVAIEGSYHSSTKLLKLFDDFTKVTISEGTIVWLDENGRVFGYPIKSENAEEKS